MSPAKDVVVQEASAPVEAVASKPVVEKVQEKTSASKPVASAPQKSTAETSKASPEPVAAAATAEKKKGGKLLLSF